jgi:hypothetical protein
MAYEDFTVQTLIGRGLASCMADCMHARLVGQHYPDLAIKYGFQLLISHKTDCSDICSSLSLDRAIYHCVRSPSRSRQLWRNMLSTMFSLWTTPVRVNLQCTLALMTSLSAESPSMAE